MIQQKKRLLPCAFIALCALAIAACNSTGSSMIKTSDMVKIVAVAEPGETQTFKKGAPDGTGGGDYTVPAGKLLVITRVIIQSMNPGPGKLDLTFIQSGGGISMDRIRDTWRVPNTQPTEYDFSPGCLVSSGSILKLRNNSTSVTETAVLIFGYETIPQ